MKLGYLVSLMFFFRKSVNFLSTLMPPPLPLGHMSGICQVVGVCHESYAYGGGVLVLSSLNLTFIEDSPPPFKTENVFHT